MIGILLDSSETDPVAITHLEAYFANVMQCFMVGANKHLKKGHENNAVSITMNSISSIDFWVSQDDKKKMISVGYETIKNRWTSLLI